MGGTGKEIEFKVSFSMGFGGDRAEGSIVVDGKQLSWWAFRSQGVWHPRLNKKKAKGLGEGVGLIVGGYFFLGGG